MENTSVNNSDYLEELLDERPKPSEPAVVANDLLAQKYFEIELQKRHEALVSLQNLRTQIGTFVGTANFAALGLAFSNTQAGLVMLSSGLFILFIAVDYIARSLEIAYYFRYINIKSLFVKRDPFADIQFDDHTMAEISRIGKIADIRQQTMELRKLSRSLWTFIGFLLPLLICLCEVTLGMVLWLYYGWKLF
ncbi:MAG: hypothetical protein IPP13_02985 [Kouleothrix sp.]|jgi:hypothetical protein|nr:hypothetical protein [Kouleothrix sp.]